MEPVITLEGMYDLHVHASPSIAPRKLTALEVLKRANVEGMGGFLLVDHTYNTAAVAQVLNEMGYGTEVYGSIILNESVGELNPAVVEAAIRLGARQIEMPTYSARSHKEKYGDDQKIFPYQTGPTGCYILNDRGRLHPEVEEILQLLKGSHCFLGTGHLSVPEIEVLVGRASELHLKVLVNSVSLDMIDMPLSSQKRLAADNIFLEHDYTAFTDIVRKKTPIEAIVEQIRQVGAERCVIASDAGNPNIPDPVAALKDFIRRLLNNGITESEVNLMTRETPRLLLGIS